MKLSLPILIQLNAKTDRLIELRGMDDDEDRGWNLGGKAMGIGTGAGLLAGGSYLRGRSALNTLKPGKAAETGINATMGVGLGQLGNDAMRPVNYIKKVGGAAGTGWSAGKGFLGGIGGAAKQAWEIAKKTKLSSRHERLIQLNARIDSLITFEKEPDQDDMKGKKMKGKKGSPPWMKKSKKIAC